MNQRYQLIKQLAGEHSVQALCRTLRVSRAGYYVWLRGRSSHRAQKDAQLSALLQQEHQQSRSTYGRPRLQARLRSLGHRHGGKRIARLMKAARLCGRPRRRFVPCTTQSNHSGPIAPNLLAQRNAPTMADEVWITDLTYVQTAEGWLYVSAILDRFSRRVVGWAFGPSLDATLPLAALRMAVRHRKPRSGLVHHSDRGCQYASSQYREQLHLHGLHPSMSRAANCYDNATMESFWSTLKQELVYRHKFLTRAQASAAIFDYIQTFYNPIRLHSALGYKSPVDFEHQNN
jgi:putative transposase